MLNPIANEAIYSATYVDNYIDSVENLPDDIQRHLSRIRDIDVQYRGHIRDVDYYYYLWKSPSNTSENSENRRARAIARMQASLIHAQELGDEKMHIVTQLQELIDFKTRQLDSDQKNLDIKEEQQAAQQQHALRGVDDFVYSGTSQKASRSQSPNGGIPLPSLGGIGTSSTGGQISSAALGKDSLCNAFSSVNSGSGVNTIVNERSNVGSNIISGSGSSNGSNNYAIGDGRSSKRPRRQRNEIVMELGGNESNSANEGGGSGDHGCIASGSGSSGGNSSQKQNASNQSISAVHKKTHQTGQTGNINANNTGASSSGGSASTNKKKKRKARGAQASNAHSNTREDTPPVDPIDPDEPTYCLCDQISFGEMILCDNDLCPIEWFHFSCVSLVFKPKGKWYCPNCRGDRQNVMKPKAQFLKELERYNKEKEEKT